MITICLVIIAIALLPIAIELLLPLILAVVGIGMFGGLILISIWLITLPRIGH